MFGQKILIATNCRQIGTVQFFGSLERPFALKAPGAAFHDDNIHAGKKNMRKPFLKEFFMLFELK
tara:strand:- start:136655 stop:136849 length:195 start_codon:yes stop_codon:yes gene_type:complete